jgi:hypothetical protein
MLYRFFASACLLAACSSYAAAEEKDPRPAAGVQDNSFLIEEAYNQDPGMIQHTALLRRQGKDWSLNLSQEWPIASQTHQFSYAVPYLWLRSDGQHASGFGDAQLSYRYQLATETSDRPAIAPRFSIIVPTGRESAGLGNRSVGYQFNLPVSKIVSDRVTLHANAGLTTYADVGGHQPTSYNLGGSAIYAITRQTNVLLEVLGDWTETVTPASAVEREFALTLVPGVRHAMDLWGGQLVLGLAAPVTIVDRKADYGALLLVSFEHAFTR